MARQHATPIVIDNLERPTRIQRLERLYRATKPGFGARFVEDLLQHLIHEDPSILPVEELEPAFSALRSVCRELRLKSTGTEKYVDNLLINPNGRICLVECKLWRNPEAVREVVAQVLDYAAELSLLSYDDLAAMARQTLGLLDGDPVSDRVLGIDAQEEEKATFIDSVTRSLSRGDFLLLVVGDGIRAGLQQIASLLQNRATLGFSFGLVEMAIYSSKGGLGPYYVQPRLLLQSEIITRTVFIAAGERTEAKISKVEPAGKPQTISEQDFFEQLAQIDPTYPDRLRAFFDQCRAIGCYPQLRRRFVLYVDDPTGGRINVGTIAKDGNVEIWGTASHDRQFGQPIGRQYMERVAAFLPDARIKDDFPSAGNWHIRHHGKTALSLGEMLSHQGAWLAAIQEMTDCFRALERIQELEASNEALSPPARA